MIWKVEFRFAYDREALRSGAQDSACLVIDICKKVCDSCRFSLIACGASLWGLPYGVVYTSDKYGFCSAASLHQDYLQFRTQHEKKRQYTYTKQALHLFT